ncbi:hypothetical protein [Streptomyces sp. NPDC007206]|uniref:hypothetical protein n=1 Tax=Streptomyces sp. NPDC007206 TaxID=3154317 RepID=UPI0033CD8089
MEQVIRQEKGQHESWLREQRQAAYVAMLETTRHCEDMARQCVEVVHHGGQPGGEQVAAIREAHRAMRAAQSLALLTGPDSLRTLVNQLAVCASGLLGIAQSATTGVDLDELPWGDALVDFLGAMEPFEREAARVLELR